MVWDHRQTPTIKWLHENTIRPLHLHHENKGVVQHHHSLGMWLDFNKTEGTLQLSQVSYINQMIESTGINNTPLSVPASAKEIVDATDPDNEDSPPFNQKTYQTAVGKHKTQHCFHSVLLATMLTQYPLIMVQWNFTVQFNFLSQLC